MNRVAVLTISLSLFTGCTAGEAEAPEVMASSQAETSAHPALAPIEYRLRTADLETLTILAADHTGDPLESAVAANILRDDNALMRHIGRMVTDTPDAPSTHIFQALLLRLAGDHRGALALVREALRESDDPWVIYHGASTYLAAGLYGDAAVHANEALTHSVDGPRPLYEALNLSATALRRQDNNGEALGYALLAVEGADEVGDPVTLSYRYQVARLQAALGDYVTARQGFVEAAELAEAMIAGDTPMPVGASTRSMHYMAAISHSGAGLLGLAQAGAAGDAMPFFEASDQHMRLAIPPREPGLTSAAADSELLRFTLALATWGHTDAASELLDAHPAIRGAGVEEAYFYTLAFLGRWDEVLSRTENIEDTQAGGTPFDADRLRNLLRSDDCEPRPVPGVCDGSFDSLAIPMGCALRGSDFPALVTLAGEAVRCEGRTDPEMTVFTWYLQLGVEMETQREALQAQLLDLASGT